MGDDEQSNVPVMPNETSLDEASIEEQADGEAPATDQPVVEWQAGEYVHHDKSMRWYLGLLGVLVLLMATALFTREWLSIGVFVMMAVAVAVYARRPPHILNYLLDDQGVHIENKSYPYSQFRSFGVLQDADWKSIDLEPTQRFMPRLSLLFDDEELDQITSRLEAELPRVDRRPDLVERVTHAIKF